MRRAGAALVVGLMAIGAAASPAAAHGYRLGAITIGHFRAGPVKPGATAIGVYGPLLNNGKTADVLVAATTPIAAKTRFRIKKGGPARWLDSVAVPAGSPVILARWRQHLWLTGLKRPLEAGTSFPLTLVFRHAGRITIQVVVGREGTH
jgi:copper(I)-binding protein